MEIDRTRTDEQVRWYLNNKQIFILNQSQIGEKAWREAIQHGFFLKLDLAMGGAFPNSVSGYSTPTPATTSGGQLSIDSVVVSQKTGTPPAPFTTPGVPAGSSVVKVTGTQGNWQLMVNGAPYTLKGLTYGPPADASEGYFNDMKSMGVNTIRTWGTDAGSKVLLDNAAARGLKVVAGHWLNHGANYADDTAYKTNTLTFIKEQVNAYKAHPAILMWDVGNEVLLTLQDTYSGAELERQRNAYAAYVNVIARELHAIDPNHPVTSTDAWTGGWPYYKNNSPDLDLYALNAYGDICNAKQTWITMGINKPYIITEGGPAGEWEVPNDINSIATEPTDIAKRDGYTSSWECIKAHPNVALGATMFHYGIEDDFGGVWLNIVNGNWNRLAYHSVKEMYGGGVSANKPPVISSMTVGNQTAVEAGKPFTVSVGVTDPNAGDLLRYNVMFSNKHVNANRGFLHTQFTETGPGAFSVTAPQEMGVWKVYVYVYDGAGNVGIEQKSFRVVAPKVNGTNIALGKATSASTYQQVGNGAPYPPSNVVDGNTATRWSTDWADPQWVQIDLGSVQTFNHIQLAWEGASAKSYRIETSANGIDGWTSLYSTTTGDGGFDSINVNGNARHVRMTGTVRNTTYGYSLYEFGIYKLA